MSIQMYFVIPKGAPDADAMRVLMHDIRRMGGFILMATSGGPIVALDDEDLPALREHAMVQLANPVALNPRGLAVKQLERIFTDNLHRQLGALVAAPSPEETTT